MTFLLFLQLLNFAQIVNPKNTTQLLEVDTKIIGGQVVRRREDFSYQVCTKIVSIIKMRFCAFTLRLPFVYIVTTIVEVPLLPLSTSLQRHIAVSIRTVNQ